jgi:hypothetical protein
MNAQEMSDVILKIIDDRKEASIVEIVQAIGPEARGDFAWELFPNAIMWAGVSECLVDAFRLIRSAIEPRLARPFVYLCDGEYLKLPIAKRPTPRGYKEPHWLPVCFVRREITQ